MVILYNDLNHIKINKYTFLDISERHSLGSRIYVYWILSGFFQVNYRLQVLGPCDMNLELFPLDVQVCELVIESYAYNTVIVKYFPHIFSSNNSNNLQAKVALNWRDWNPVCLLLPWHYTKFDFFFIKYKLLYFPSRELESAGLNLCALEHQFPFVFSLLHKGECMAKSATIQTRALWFLC